MKKLAVILMTVMLVVSGLSGGCKSEEEKLKEELFPKMEEMGSLPALKYIEKPEAKGKLQVSPLRSEATE